jgi:putative DNA primase/helicase
MIAEIRGLIVNELIPIVHKITWNDVSGIPFQNGVLDVRTMQLRPHSPDDFITRLIDREYNPDEDCPNWKQVLKDCFPEEPDVVKLIQEVAGAGLIGRKPRSITTALVLVGPPRSGKSNLLEVLASIYSDKRNSTPVDMLDKSHGTMNFLDQTPWVLDEAFESGKWHGSATVKAILTGEPIGVNIKNGPQTNIAFRAPIFWGSNVMPQFKEMTEAIKQRLTVVRCGQVFDKTNMTPTAKTAIELGYANPAEYVIETELPGIINWAIEGLVRAISQNVLSTVNSVEEAAEMIHESGNYAIEFLRDCTVLDPTKMVNNSDLYGAFSVWWKENRGEGNSSPSPVALLTAIAALHRKDIVKSPEKFNNHRPILGIALSDTGQDLWTAAFNEANNRGTSQRFSDSVDQINKDIPPKWLHIIKTKPEGKK